MSFNKVNKTTGELTRSAGNGDIPIDSAPTQGSTNAVQSGGTFSAIKAVESKIGEVTVKTLAANVTSISFTVPTSGNNLIDFWASDGSNYTAIDTSVSGTVTLTYDAVSSARTIFCKISEV